MEDPDSKALEIIPQPSASKLPWSSPAPRQTARQVSTSARMGAGRYMLRSKPAPAWKLLSLFNARLYLLDYSLVVSKWLPGPNWLAGGKRGWSMHLSKCIHVDMSMVFVPAGCGSPAWRGSCRFLADNQWVKWCREPENPAVYMLRGRVTEPE